MRDRLSKRGRVYHGLVSAELCLESLAQEMWVGVVRLDAMKGVPSLLMCPEKGDFDGCV